MRPLTPTSLITRFLELLLMYLVLLSQPHNGASVLELSRSLEFEHGVRRELTLQVPRWFGRSAMRADRWKMDIGKRWYVKSAWVFCVNTSDPISEDQLMTKWNIAVGDTFISDAHFRRIPLRAFSTLLFEHVNTLIPWAELPIDRDFE